MTGPIFGSQEAPGHLWFEDRFIQRPVLID